MATWFDLSPVRIIREVDKGREEGRKGTKNDASIPEDESGEGEEEGDIGG